MSLIHPGQRNKTFIPQPFEIRRGSHGIDERVESGDALDPKNKADMLYSGDVMGEVRTPPYISNYNDGISHDSSSTMTVEGRASEHWTRTRQKLDFTVKDADKEPNLQVTVKRDFTGQGRLEIRNRGEFGGDGRPSRHCGAVGRKPPRLVLTDSRSGGRKYLPRSQCNSWQSPAPTA